MEKELFECCQLMIKILNDLLIEGKITQEEYDEHIAIKMEFLKKKAPKWGLKFPCFCRIVQYAEHNKQLQYSCYHITYCAGVDAKFLPYTCQLAY